MLSSAIMRELEIVYIVNHPPVHLMRVRSRSIRRTRLSGPCSFPFAIV